MVQVCMAAEGAGVSGVGGGARKVIKNHTALTAPSGLRISEKKGKDKCLTSRYPKLCFGTTRRFLITNNFSGKIQNRTSIGGVALV